METEASLSSSLSERIFLIKIFP